MPVPYTKTADDKKIEQNDLRTNRTLKHLLHVNFYKFAIGDVLIREDKVGDKWVTYTASCGLPYKYVYAFENELKVGYIRRLAISGTNFVESPMCVLNFDPETTRFSLDPSYADHILLSEDQAFDLKASYKVMEKKRNAMHRANNKLRVPLKTSEEVIAFLRNLKVGDKLWTGWNRSRIGKEPLIVNFISIDPVDVDQSYVELKNNAWPTSPYRRNLRSIMGRWYFTTRPQFLDEILS